MDTCDALHRRPADPPAGHDQPDNIRRVARKIRLFHQRGPVLPGEANLFHRVDVMVEACRKASCRFPADFDWIMQRVNEVRRMAESNPRPPAPIHADLLNLIFLDENAAGERREVRMLDWERAGMGDIYHAPANFSHHHRFNDDRVRVLLAEYCGEATPSSFARLKLMWVASEADEAMWGTTQPVISKLDEDFQGYADLWFGRIREACLDPRWGTWLKEAGKA